MPLFDYKCECGYVVKNVLSKLGDPVKCEKCGKPMKRQFGRISPRFKGKGFYETDYKEKKDS